MPLAFLPYARRCHKRASLEIRPKTLQLENSPASRISLGQGRHK